MDSAIIQVVLIYIILLVLLIIVFIPIIRDYKYSKGKKRMISGEVLKDIGIAVLVSSAFKYSFFELSFWIIAVIGAVLIIFGTRMKYDGK